MNKRWFNRLSCVEARETDQQAREFVKLVYEARGKCSIEAARHLMRTFRDAPDLGTQECVVAVLKSASPSVRIEALLEEMPRLVEEGWEWALDLTMYEFRNNPQLILDELAKTRGRQLSAFREVLRALVQEEQFAKRYPQIKELLR